LTLSYPEEAPRPSSGEPKKSTNTPALRHLPGYARSSGEGVAVLSDAPCRHVSWWHEHYLASAGRRRRLETGQSNLAASVDARVDVALRR